MLLYVNVKITLLYRAREIALFALEKTKGVNITFSAARNFFDEAFYDSENSR